MLKQFKAIFELTRREEDVLSYLITGKPNKGIAQSLSIAVRTVKTHITNIYKKLGVSNKIQMVNLLKNFNLF
jgi:DNA-binding NarL/FixJ family response regulator